MRPGPATHWLWLRGVWAWGPSPTPQRTLLEADFARCGSGTRAPGGGRLLPACRASGVRSSPTPDRMSFGRAAGAHCPLAVNAGDVGLGTRHQPHAARSCQLALHAVGATRGRPLGTAVYGTFSCAAVRRVLCALAGFVAPVGRCCLVSVLVPLLRPAACLSDVPHGPVLVHSASCDPVALGAPVGFFRRRGAFAQPGGCRPWPYWAGARGTRRLAENWAHCACRWPLPRQGRWVCSVSYPFRARDGIVPGWSPWLLSWAACAAVVWRVWTQSLTRPVSCIGRLSTVDLAGAPGLFRVDADTSPFGSEDATPRSRACVPVRALLGRVRQAGLPGAF